MISNNETASNIPLTQNTISERKKRQVRKPDRYGSGTSAGDRRRASLTPEVQALKNQYTKIFGHPPRGCCANDPTYLRGEIEGRQNVDVVKDNEAHCANSQSQLESPPISTKEVQQLLDPTKFNIMFILRKAQQLLDPTNFNIMSILKVFFLFLLLGVAQIVSTWLLRFLYGVFYSILWKNAPWVHQLLQAGVGALKGFLRDLAAITLQAMIFIGNSGLRFLGVNTTTLLLP